MSVSTLGGQRIDIELVYDENMPRIRDNGKGMDPRTLQSGKAGHYGLTGTRERSRRVSEPNWQCLGSPPMEHNLC